MLDILKQELRNLKSPLYRNSIYISLASLTTAVAGFLFWAIAARLYPAQDVGVASAIVSALNLTFNLSMLGMNFAIINVHDAETSKTRKMVILKKCSLFNFSGGDWEHYTKNPEHFSVCILEGS